MFLNKQGRSAGNIVPHPTTLEEDWREFVPGSFCVQEPLHKISVVQRARSQCDAAVEK